MSPTPAPVEGSGTPNSDDASHPASIDNSATLKTVSLYNEFSVTTSIPPSQPLQPRPVLSTPPPLSSTSHPGPEMILATLQFVGASALAVCKVIDKAIELEHKERHTLQGLRKGVDSLKSDTLVYKVLLNAVENDTDLSGGSPYARFIQRCVMVLRSSSYAHRANALHYHKQDGKESMESLERALKATRLLLEMDPANHHHKSTINPSGSKNPRIALHFVLNTLKANFRPGHRHGLIGDLKDATSEIFVCQQDNERAFKLVWNLYVVAQQWTGRHSVDNVGNIQDRFGQALDSVLHAFHVHPFAVSPEGDSRVDLPTFAILKYNHETATRHETLARRIGKAGWMTVSADTMRRLETSVPCKPRCLSSYGAGQ